MSVSEFEYLGIYGLGGQPTSTGIDEIADKLKALGLYGNVISQVNAQSKGLDLVGDSPRKLIIFGYSMGATDAIDIADALVYSGKSVPLLFTMDPHGKRSQVNGVTKHINVHQPNNLLVVKEFHAVDPDPEAQGQLINILAQEVRSHGEIDNAPFVQDMFLNEVKALIYSGETYAPVVTVSQSSDAELPWIADLQKYMDLHEVHDRRKLIDYLKSDGTALGDPSKHPWCGDAVETPIKNTLPDEKVPDNPYWARNWAKFGEACEPKFGCIMVFTRGKGGHVGFYMGETETHYEILGGNQSNRVTVSEYKKSRLIASRWPLTYDARAITKAVRQTSEPTELAELHKAFFDAVREPLFGGRMNQSQVDGMKGTLALWVTSALTDIRWLAYMFATTWLETAYTMQPISEYGGDAYFRKMYDIKGARPKKAKELGNLSPGDGIKYHGRGKPMITGKGNYARADKYIGTPLGVSFVEKPSLVLIGDYSDRIMFSGMTLGWFTGKRLSDYFNDTTEAPVNARRIVNGTDRAEEIADAYWHFKAALEAGFKAYDEALKHVEVIAPNVPIEIERPPFGPISPPSPQEIDEMTTPEIIQALHIAVVLLAERDGVELLSPSPNLTLPARPKSHGELNLGVLETSKKETTMQGLMAALRGKKTHITMLTVAMIAFTEGYLGIDVPGVEMQDNWVEWILQAGGVSSVRDGMNSMAKTIADRMMR